MSERRAMGELESEVLMQVWAMPDGATPAAVLEAMGDDLAYTTVMTILTRLWHKGLLERERRGRAYSYRAKVSESELYAQRMHDLLRDASDRKGALAAFVESLSARDARALRSALDEMTRRR